MQREKERHKQEIKSEREKNDRREMCKLKREKDKFIIVKEVKSKLVVVVVVMETLWNRLPRSCFFDHYNISLVNRSLPHILP